MDFLKYVDTVKRELMRYLEEGAEINVNSVRKNNGVMLTGIVIMEKGSHIAPTIYLESFYEEYKRGKRVEDTVFELLKIYEKNRITHGGDFQFFQDYKQVQKRIFYKLIHAEKNRELLQEIPHVPYLDLAIVFGCDCSNEMFGNATILIKNSHLKMWGVDVETIYQAAVVNTPKNFPYEIKTMNAVMKEMFAADIRSSMEKNKVSFSEQWIEQMAEQMVGEETEENTPMYVLTNTDRTHGAACILYKQLLEGFAQEIHDNLYILPSSVHEIIMIPAAFAGKVVDLKEMVVEINATQVEAEEVLSDSVYFFNRLTGKLELA